jgi:hypothetical protein
MDLRVPLGSMFGLLGLLLFAYGLLGDPSVYQSSLGININLWSGLGMALFGALMLLGAWRGRARTAD